MTLFVKSWVGPENEKRLANVILNGIEMDLLVKYDYKRTIEEYQNIFVEFNYEAVRNIELINCSGDSDTKITPCDGAYEIIGKIHNAIECGPGKYLIDLYMQLGPEFIYVDVTRDFSDHTGKYVRVIVSKLCCYPVFY